MTGIKKYTSLLKQMLAIPALSREEKLRADFLNSWLIDEGLKVQRVNNNLIVSSGGDPASAKLLLNSHIDTVPASGTWNSDPIIPQVEDGKITALGSNDAGASVVSLIACYLSLKELKLTRDLVLVLSAEEEISGSEGISSVLAELPSLEFAIVGEPTGMQPAVAERGLMVVDAVAYGTAGHAARNEGNNAIYKAIRDIQKIGEISFFDHSDWLEDPSIHVTMIQAGSKHNIVPDQCSFVIDVRSNDSYSNERLLDILQAHCKSQLKPRSMRLRSSFLPEEHPVFPILTEEGLFPFGSPTLSDMALLDIPAIKLGPGNSARSHTADEYILESEIEEGIEVYSALIQQLVKKVI